MATAQDNTVMTVYNGRCETSSCNLTSTLDLPALSPSEAAVVFSKRQIKEEMKLQTDGRKETKQKKREKTDREQRWGLRYADTKPTQLRKHGSGSSPPVGDVVAEIWVWHAVSECRAPGLLLESCRVISSNWLGRESVVATAPNILKQPSEPSFSCYTNCWIGHSGK